MSHAPNTLGTPPVVALLTDFGLSDPYVGQMKAVLTSLAPQAAILDISHGVPPHDLLAGAFFLAASLPWLPPGTVTVAVIDPGVGSSRRLVGIQCRGRLVLAPDNGLISLVLAREPADGAWMFEVPPQASATFHGRDVFAPLAAALVLGRPVDELGHRVDPASLVRLPDLDPVLDNGRLTATVLHEDQFGNLILALPIAEHGPRLRAARGLALDLPGAPRLVRSPTYAAIPFGVMGLVAGSQGQYELAMNQDSAAKTTGLGSGDRVTLVVDPGAQGDQEPPLESVSER